MRTRGLNQFFFWFFEGVSMGDLTSHLGYIWDSLVYLFPKCFL